MDKFHCSIPDCDRKRFARGWCRNHYARWFRTGTPHGTGTPPGEPKRFIEEVALPFDGDECLIWPYTRDGFGYGKTSDGSYVHRLVCEAANGPPPSPSHEVAHSCGNGHGGCISPKHVRWATRGENARDKVLHGRSLRGAKNPTAKLTEAQILQIRSLKDELTQAAIAKKFGVSKQTISLILKGEVWGWLLAPERNSRDCR